MVLNFKLHFFTIISFIVNLICCAKITPNNPISTSKFDQLPQVINSFTFCQIFIEILDDCLDINMSQIDQPYNLLSSIGLIETLPLFQLVKANCSIFIVIANELNENSELVFFYPRAKIPKTHLIYFYTHMEWENAADYFDNFLTTNFIQYGYNGKNGYNGKIHTLCIYCSSSSRKTAGIQIPVDYLENFYQHIVSLEKILKKFTSSDRIRVSDKAYPGLKLKGI